MTKQRVTVHNWGYIASESNQVPENRHHKARIYPINYHSSRIFKGERVDNYIEFSQEGELQFRVTTESGLVSTAGTPSAAWAKLSNQSGPIMFGLEETGVKDKLYTMFSAWADKMVKQDPGFIVPNIDKPHVHTARKKTKSMLNNQSVSSLQSNQQQPNQLQPSISLKKRRKRNSSADSMDTEPASTSAEFDVPREFQFQVNPTRFFNMAARGNRNSEKKHQQKQQQQQQENRSSSNDQSSKIVTQPMPTRAGSKRSHDDMITGDDSPNGKTMTSSSQESDTVNTNQSDNNGGRRRSSRVAKLKRNRASVDGSPHAMDQDDDDDTLSTTSSSTSTTTVSNGSKHASQFVSNQESDNPASKRRRLDQQRQHVDRAMRQGNDPSNVMQLSAMLESMSPSLHYRKQQHHHLQQPVVISTPKSTNSTWDRLLQSEDDTIADDVDDSATDLFRYEDDEEDLLTFDMFDNFSLESDTGVNPSSTRIIRSESPPTIREQLHQLNSMKKRQYREYVHCMNRMEEIVMLAKNARDVDSNMPFVAAQMAQYTTSLMQMAKVNQSITGRMKQLERERMLTQL